MTHHFHMSSVPFTTISKGEKCHSYTSYHSFRWPCDLNLWECQQSILWEGEPTQNIKWRQHARPSAEDLCSPTGWNIQGHSRFYCLTFPPTSEGHFPYWYQRRMLTCLNYYNPRNLVTLQFLLRNHKELIQFSYCHNNTIADAVSWGLNCGLDHWITGTHTYTYRNNTRDFREWWTHREHCTLYHW